MLHRSFVGLLLVIPLLSLGCSRTETPPAPTAATTGDEAAKSADASKSEFVFAAATYEADANQLLDSRLPIERTTEGWVRLFDGHTLFGWAIAGEANWRVEDGKIVVDRGRQCLLTASTRWSDFELELQFQCEDETNSGVFVRTQLDPQNVQTDCYEINIAPLDNPFPTGGIVQRKKGTPVQTNAQKWHSMNILCDGDTVRVTIDGEVTCELSDATTPSNGYIGLQYNSGPVAFRDIQLRPLGLKNLINADLKGWTAREGMDGEFRVNDEGHLVVDGGKQQLETNSLHGDFTMLADYKMDDVRSNSGLFFRAIPGDEMMGYECQVSNEMIDDQPLQPADCGAGGIFKRQDARVVAGEPKRWNSILLKADGPHFATWVNGLQVTDLVDKRDANENPRRGLRLEPGSIIVQGHDKTTQAVYRQISVAESPL